MRGGLVHLMERPVLTVLVIASTACAHTVPTMPEWWDDRDLTRIVEQKRTRATLHVAPFLLAANLPDQSIRLDEMLTTALRETGRVDVSREDDIARTAAYQGIAQTGMLSDAEKVAQVGEMVGAEAQVVGSLSSASQQILDKFAYDLVRTEVRVDARVVDTTTNQATFTATAMGHSEAKRITDSSGRLVSGAIDNRAEYTRAASAAMKDLARAIANRFPLVGVVLSASPSEATVDVGAGNGLRVGDPMLVFRAGGQLTHPVSGAAMGWNKVVVARGRVARVERSRSVVQFTTPYETTRPGDAVLLDREPGK
jgi:hypothetical protein